LPKRRPFCYNYFIGDLEVSGLGGQKNGYETVLRRGLGPLHANQTPDPGSGHRKLLGPLLSTSLLGAELGVVRSARRALDPSSLFSFHRRVDVIALKPWAGTNIIPRPLRVF
jgi:hypothetical protein